MKYSIQIGRVHDQSKRNKENEARLWPVNNETGWFYFLNEYGLFDVIYVLQLSSLSLHSHGMGLFLPMLKKNTRLIIQSY